MSDTIKNRFNSGLTAFLVTGILILFTSCSSESFTQEEDDSKKKGEQTFTFIEEENGKDVHYEVNFKDGKISSIYKDNEKIPENEIKDYEDLVYDNLNSLSRDEDDFFVHPKPYVYHFDTDDFKDSMKELKGKHFNFKFDNDKFKDDMDKLKEELKDLDEIVIEIDGDKIRKEIDEGLKHLKELKIHKFDFDDEFDKNIIIELDRDIKDREMNMEELEEEMEELNEEMDGLSEEMKELDTEMKTLDKFLDEVKTELVKDGLIGSTEEKFEYELTEEKMEVNDIKVSDELHNKYKELYKKHFNKELDGRIKIKI